MKNSFNGKMKAVTFSFDDGVTQDIKLIEILNKYGLKATFNLNSALLGTNGELNRNNNIVRHDKNPADKIAEIYRGHEVAVHTLVHPNLTELSDEGVIWQVEEDRKLLESLVGYDVRCMGKKPRDFGCQGCALASMCSQEKCLEELDGLKIETKGSPACLFIHLATDSDAIACG